MMLVRSPGATSYCVKCYYTYYIPRTPHRIRHHHHHCHRRRPTEWQLWSLCGSSLLPLLLHRVFHSCSSLSLSLSMSDVACCCLGTNCDGQAVNFFLLELKTDPGSSRRQRWIFFSSMWCQKIIYIFHRRRGTVPQRSNLHWNVTDFCLFLRAFNYVICLCRLTPKLVKFSEKSLITRKWQECHDCDSYE